jgi:hypothetical protein
LFRPLVYGNKVGGWRSRLLSAQPKKEIGMKKKGKKDDKKTGKKGK